MPEKLSVLIFSRNDVRDALGLLKDIYDIADEIVIVDSSTKKQHRVLLNERFRHPKLKVVYVVPIGYPDPLRMYALSKCRNMWVLLMDTDERLSDYAKNNILKEISDTDASAFAIKRYEYVKKDIGRFYTWQVRLFRKDKVKFRGTLHEQPIVNGATVKARDDFNIRHLIALGRHSESEYSKITVFDRMTYWMFRNKLLDYANKAVLPEKGHVNKTVFGRSVNALLNFYQKLRLKNDQEELSYFDYLIFYFLVDTAYQVKDRGLLGIITPVKLRTKYLNYSMKSPKGLTSDEVLDISRIIYGRGITNFLRLNDETVIKRINRRFKNRTDGIALLIEMIIRRYKDGVNWLDDVN